MENAVISWNIIATNIPRKVDVLKQNEGASCWSTAPTTQQQNAAHTPVITLSSDQPAVPRQPTHPLVSI
jgi:hypothetical protein